jgi:hypothetical protein
MAEFCPRCKSYTLSYDGLRRSARCYRLACDYEVPVANGDEYFNEFVISKGNYSNYCSMTPPVFRKEMNVSK